MLGRVQSTAVVYNLLGQMHDNKPVQIRVYLKVAVDNFNIFYRAMVRFYHRPIVGLLSPDSTSGSADSTLLSPDKNSVPMVFHKNEMKFIVR